MGIIWDHYPQGGGELLTALAMADHADHAGHDIWPSVERVARMTKQSRRAVQYHFKAMVKRGWLVAEQAGGGRTKTTRYRIPIELIPQGGVGTVQILHPLPKPGVQSPTGKGAISDKKPCKAFAPEPSLPVREPSVLGAGGTHRTYQPDFEAAFKVYPQRSGNNPKLDAAKAWTARIREGVAPEVMLAGVKRYAAWCAGTEKTGTEFVMRASTFFGPSKPYEQGFPLSPDTTKATLRSEPRCIWFAEGQPPSTRCLADGDGAPVAIMELGGHKVALRMCGRHSRDPVMDKPGPTGRLVHRPEIRAAIERFKQYALANLVPA